MKQDPRTFINTDEDHTFNKPIPTDKKVKLDVVEKMERLYLTRKDAYLPMYVIPNPKATITVILLLGGDAHLGAIVNGKPSNTNFMSRTSDYFNENFNVIVVYRASDLNSVTFTDLYRQTNHVHEIEKVIDFANKKFKKPIWLISTSRGTLSAVSTAIAIGNKKVKGIVLTSTITSQNFGLTLPHYGAAPIISLDIPKITIPILMVHHINDACWLCKPEEASALITKFSGATIKKFIMITGGSDPISNPCSPLHWHGYHNYERETVKVISDWIKKPVL